VSGPVPWVDLSAALAGPSVREAVSRVLDSGRLIGGDEVTALETVVADWMGRAHGVAVSSGTAALELGLVAMGVGSGDEVIVPAVSFVATVGAVLRTGATPVVVDVLPAGPWMDPDAAEAAVTAATAAIIPVHLFGSPAQAPQLGLPIFDDACQAVAPKGPSTGLCTALSFYPTKVLGGMGEGGMVVTDDESLARRLSAIRQHGCDSSGCVVEPGGTNARLNAVSAAVIHARMLTINEEIERRRTIAEAYDAVVGHRAVPRAPNSPVSTYALVHPRRDRVVEGLAEAGIPTAVYYPRFVHDHPAIRERVRVPHLLPNATRYCRQTLALPCHGGLSDADVSRVVAALGAVL
jgi:UDP-2-acetamido-2-deoxy-ribo-hexuluronate aminotransferase